MLRLRSPARTTNVISMILMILSLTPLKLTPFFTRRTRTKKNLLELRTMPRKKQALRNQRKRKLESDDDEQEMPPLKKQKVENEENDNENISPQQSYFFILQWYYYQNVHPLPSNICEHISEYCALSLNHSDYLIIVRVLSACYDIWCAVKHKLLKNVTEQSAIKHGQKMYFDEINGAFRNGANACKPDEIVRFELSKIESYKEDYFRELWEGSDTNGQPDAIPGGPALLTIFECGGTSQSELIYHLPIDSDPTEYI